MIIIKIGGGGSINIKGIIADLVDLKDRFVIVHGATDFDDDHLPHLY